MSTRQQLIKARIGMLALAEELQTSARLQESGHRTALRMQACILLASPQRRSSSTGNRFCSGGSHGFKR